MTDARTEDLIRRQPPRLKTPLRRLRYMAETVQDSMSQSLRLVNRGVKQAGFYVLGGAAMPAILIEIGFLTNRKEEKKLGTPEHREALARAIYAGLAEYKRRYDQRMRTAQSAPSRSAPPSLPAR